MQLRHKLPLAFAVALALLFGAGMFGIRSLNHTVNVFKDDVLHHVDGHKIGAEISAHFATAIQEWKDVLLRGKDAQEMEHHWSAHLKQMEQVNQLILTLQDSVRDDAEIRPLVTQMVEEMKNAQEGYKKAFEAYKAAGNDYAAGDAAAKGCDRKAAAQLAAIREALSKAENQTTEQAIAEAQTSTLEAVLVMVVVAVASLLASVWLSRRITAPIAEAVALSEKVADGDLTTPIHATGSDEVGVLLASLQTMQGNLTRLVLNVRDGSSGVATASAEIAQGNHDLSTRTEQQASALEETAASMEELGATVKQNAQTAQQAKQLAMTASAVAHQGGDVVAQVVETMKGIHTASSRIADIIGVIDGIAFQTNILALNAAVEAARAGEQGRGFAVVASEVRSLAGRSAEAAREIKSLINASVERVEQGSSLVDQAGATMVEVVDAIRKVNDLMGEISSASNQQASGVSQVGEAVTHMDQATQQNAALVEQMAAAASSLKAQAQDLVHLVDAFKLAPS